MKKKKANAVKRLESLDYLKSDFSEAIRSLRLTEDERDQLVDIFGNLIDIAENYSYALEGYEK